MRPPRNSVLADTGEPDLGAIHFSVDIELIKCLKEALPLNNFVETGTFKGDTAKSVAPHFERVFTIELADGLFKAAREALAPFSNVECLFGDSATVLSRLKASLADQGVVYWLDAHWCGTTTAGVSDECPLYREVSVLGPLNPDSVILIDDARLFLAPPPSPHNASHWPSIDRVIDYLRATSRVHGLWVINDVIIFAPLCVSGAINQYGKRFGVDLLKLATGKNSRSATESTAVPGPAKISSRDDRFRPSIFRTSRAEELFVYHLQRLKISSVLDIGANSGQFVKKLRMKGFDGLVFSVEPGSQAYVELLKNSRNDPLWIPLARQAAGERSMVARLNVSENSFSSSLLQVHENHLRAEPRTRAVAEEEIVVTKSAELVDEKLLGQTGAVKIDVQGYESDVLNGFGEGLKNIKLLMVELSMVECYEGAPTMFSVDAKLVEEFGFRRVSFEPTYYDEVSGVCQQYDGIYVSEPSDHCQPVHNRSNPISAVITSFSGKFSNPRLSNGALGSEWTRMCIESWSGISAICISLGPSVPADGIHRVETSESPTIADALLVAKDLPAGAILLTNADIMFSSALKSTVESLASGVVYYGQRIEVEPAEGSLDRLAEKGVYGWGFDYFILPKEVVASFEPQALRWLSRFRIGEPWSDYALPLVLFASGVPVKRLPASGSLARRLYHESKRDIEGHKKQGLEFVNLLNEISASKCVSAKALVTGLLQFVNGEGDYFVPMSRYFCDNLP